MILSVLSFKKKNYPVSEVRRFLELGPTVAKFGLTVEPGRLVKTPGIRECFANFECRIYERKLIKTYNFFIFEVVKARVAVSPKFPETIHYRGESIFMVSGKNIRIHSKK